MSTHKLTPKYFFLCLGVLATLIASVVSFLNLVFETLNKKFPDVLNATYQYGYNTYDYEGMRTALATLIIVFPIFFVISYFWKKQVKMGLGEIDHIIRKWMIYLILFLSAAVVMVDLVTLVRYFISGEITTRFILKVVVALIVAVLIGFYYIYELQEKKKIMSISTDYAFGTDASILVILAIVFSFVIMGSPMKQRLLRFDERRIGDLQSIQWQVINYWQQKEKLPDGLKDLKDPLSGYSLPVDPEFEKGVNYEYVKKDKMKFELCATFALPIPKGWQEYSDGGIRPMPAYEKGIGGDTTMSYPYPGPGGGTNESWDHEAGRTCFERTLDPEKYPPFTKQR
ncbi:MAG: hypothetical protein US50_C0005G0012 [Candidatus Nomurabacteria bacterium GW2011_GWB1_37_5]|uniref:DUF5671 domain-containing protein n=1 Tax=Candidatus Nomurabacteria bacterium GW2011_GWB1_37_5 TaxID=1618742 RepID=A0A0G0K562_9BACT|nr:MAG: hypothetical protein US50_C0005G0012 [Candidatus Nomurabacteria bacterium GW2011_GWB1_37_5]